MSNATRFVAALGLAGAILLPASPSHAQVFIQEDLRPIYYSPRHPARYTNAYASYAAFGPRYLMSSARRGLSPQDWVAINGANQ